MRELADGCRVHGWSFTIAGDKKSPPDFSLDGATFLSLEGQRNSGFRLGKSAPTGKYARKNIAYLHAAREGAEIIVETDDDNKPYKGFWANRDKLQSRVREASSSSKWVNVYKLFTKENIWPRGLPLDRIHDEVTLGEEISCECPIQQGLADSDPDVDAIYRLVLGTECMFDKSAPPVLIKDRHCPFNSQNTTWWREMFPLMYLPFHCSFRMTDIWRSFVAARVARANGVGVLFHAPTVYQERNAHDLARDFADETPGYLNNARIVDELDALELAGGHEHMGDDLTKCYDKLIDMGLVGDAERRLLDDWLEDIADLYII